MKVPRADIQGADENVDMDLQREWFVEMVLRNQANQAILDRGSELHVRDWWLVAGALFQTVWNLLDGRDPAAGIRDYDVFYFDCADLSWEAENRVILRAAELFAGLNVTVEIRNQARTHLWYEEHFGVRSSPFVSSRDAVDHFVSPTCCYALTRDSGGRVDVYAPYGYDDLFARRVRPNIRLAPQEVYESKAARWLREWPQLVVEPWPNTAPP